MRGLQMQGGGGQGSGGFNSGGNHNYAFGGSNHGGFDQGPGGGGHDHGGAFGRGSQGGINGNGSGGNGGEYQGGFQGEARAGGCQFHGAFQGDGCAPPQGWGHPPQGNHSHSGRGSNVPFHGGPGWNFYNSQHGGGYCGNQMGNESYNQPYLFPSNQHGGGLQQGFTSGYGNASTFKQVGAGFDPGHNGQNFVQRHGGHIYQSKGRVSRGGKFQSTHGGRFQDVGGHQGKCVQQHAKQRPTHVDGPADVPLVIIQKKKQRLLWLRMGRWQLLQILR